MTDRKQQILDVAEELLLVRGFCAFSYQDIADRLGIKKASIHHHFATKEDLGLALCERFRAMHDEVASEVLKKGGTPLELLEAFLSHGADVAGEGDRCCPGGVLQAEFNSLPERVRDEVERLFASTHQSVTAMLESGRGAGQFDFEGEASDEAWYLLSTMHGALLSARVHGPEVFEAVARQLRNRVVA
jgi:TetR/AcrR family transcriptional repressor of nem operon